MPKTPPTVRNRPVPSILGRRSPPVPPSPPASPPPLRFSHRLVATRGRRSRSPSAPPSPTLKTTRRRSPPVPHSPTANAKPRRSPPLPESPPPILHGRRSPPVPGSPRSSVEPDVPVIPVRTGVELVVSNPVRTVCWTQDGRMPEKLTVYPRADSHIRLADNKVLLGAHNIEMGNTIQRFIAGRRPGLGYWSSIRWRDSIPVRGRDHTVLLRYKGVSELTDWAEHQASVY
ncbi:hypothetical protein DFH07DRAFT_774226 [Mycena maculata]|uniref:Uncharacterized protein n=1 Tax=Mycena maculata TaxID=230809 RepID=A0AAD7J046_9AGAR|nr:hypothetical protein DFH07DRAFT_774226 [Mycena maculata]